MAELDFDNDDNLVDEEQPPIGDTSSENDAPAPKPGRRRAFIIGGVIGGVFLITAILVAYTMLNKPKPQGQIQNLSQGQAVQQEEKKKKKRKVKFIKLYDLAAEQANDVLRELSFAGINFKTEQKGSNLSVLVEEDQFSKSLNLLAIKGLPSGVARGYQILDDSQTLGVTEFDKRIKWLRALSGELEKAIMQFEKIENAKVQIVLPEQRLFAVTQPPVTASILIRKIAGAKVNDDVVFSIIQLVANAVENLQLENVSVIDTEGRVLSNGIFERMALREAGIEPETAQPQPVRKETVQAEYLPPEGKPLVPDEKELKNWYNLKKKFEEGLEIKATRQLIGILPAGSFKVAISSEIGPLQNSQVVDVRRLTASVVIDNSRDDLFVDDEINGQVFNTVAAAIGFVDERDTITLSTADFSLVDGDSVLPSQALSEENAGLGIGNYWPIALLVVVLGLGGFFGVRYARKRRVVAEDITVGDRESTDFSDIKEELQSDKKSDDVKLLAEEKPDLIASLMDKWLSEETPEEAPETAELEEAPL